MRKELHLQNRRMSYAPRTLALALLALLLSACASLAVVSAWLNDQVAFTAPQLQRALDNRYPRSFDKLGGLVAVTLANPRLSIPPGETRLRLDFDLGIGTLGARGAPTGRLSLASGLRYDPGTRGLHLDNPELLHFNLPDSGSLLRDGSRGLVNNLLAEVARSEPVYRLDDGLLARLPAGKRIDRVAIERGLAVVHLRHGDR